MTKKEIKISIHAPVKGATDHLQVVKFELYISIHAPVKGATVISTSRTICAWNFNPRSREGSDVVRILTRRQHGHFNPRSREGSDTAEMEAQKMAQHFNPRSREGSDDLLDAVGVAVVISIHAPAKGATAPPRQAGAPIRFQSTLPRRERPNLHEYINNLADFNPRSREGSDQAGERQADRGADFNPRSREGSDYYRMDKQDQAAISIHAPAKGAT